MKKRWIRAAVCLVLLIGICFTPIMPAMAEGQQEEQVIRVVFPNQHGLSEIDGDGNYSGYSYDYLMKIAQFSGWKYEFITFPDMTEDEAIVKAMEMVHTGEADLIGGMAYSEELAGEYEYSKQHYGTAYTRLATKENRYEIDDISFAEQNPLRVALREKAKIRNQEVEEYLKNRGINYTVVYTQTKEEAENLVEDRAADVFAVVNTNECVGAKEVAQINPRPFYFVATKGKTEIIGQLDAAINKINEYFPSFENEAAKKNFKINNNQFKLYANEETFIETCGTIRVLCMTDGAPYCYRNEDGEADGIAVMLLNALAANLQLEIAYDFEENRNELKQAVLDGQYSCVLGDNISAEEIEELGLISSSSYMSSNIALYAEDQKDMMDIEDKTVALPVGMSLPKSMQAGKLEYYDNVESCMEAVKEQNADCGLGKIRAIEYYMQKNLEDFGIQPLSGKSVKLNLLLTSDVEPDFLRILNRYLHSVNDETLDEYATVVNNSIEPNALNALVHNNPNQVMIAIVLIALLIMFSIMNSLEMRRAKHYNLKLEEANAAKTAFLSRITHDIRTPLNGILGMANLLHDKTDLREINQDIEQIEHSGKYLLSLVNDTLDVNQIENGKMELHPIVCDGRQELTNLFNLIKPNMQQKQIEFEVKADSLPYTKLYIDISRIEQVLINFLGNAVKFTPEYGKIVFEMINVSKSETVLHDRIMIRDNGVGMSEEFLPHMFEPFAQEEDTRTSSHTGTGLGMTISKQIIELMGGSIGVKSEKGQGTEFVIDILLPIATKEQIEENIRDKEMAEDTSILKNKRILLCEDHPLNAEITVQLLKAKEMIPECAENGQIGLDMFENSEPGYYDAVLMDIRMPVMDGLTAAKRMRASVHPQAKTIPILAMTANAFEEDVQISLEAGMNAHLLKPIEPQKVYGKLAQLFTQG